MSQSVLPLAHSGHDGIFRERARPSISRAAAPSNTRTDRLEESEAAAPGTLGGLAVFRPGKQRCQQLLEGTLVMSGKL